MKVLVTAGGTEEPIDAVRYIGNVSSGATGRELANFFRTIGHKVYFVHQRRVENISNIWGSQSFRTVDDLRLALKEALSVEHFDAVIHAAAVSDYRVTQITVNGAQRVPSVDEKIQSGHTLNLRLEPSQKLLDSLKSWSRNPEVVVIAFKLTSQLNSSDKNKAVQALFEEERADLVVHNDIGEVAKEYHKCEIYELQGLVARTDTKGALAAFIGDWLRLRKAI
jgi:phosphopantothenoylcysteine decarboxylase/phosphopantothenate--cysteine ligase